MALQFEQFNQDEYGKLKVKDNKAKQRAKQTKRERAKIKEEDRARSEPRHSGASEPKSFEKRYGDNHIRSSTEVPESDSGDLGTEPIGTAEIQQTGPCDGQQPPHSGDSPKTHGNGRQDDDSPPPDVLRKDDNEHDREKVAKDHLSCTSIGFILCDDIPCMESDRNRETSSAVAPLDPVDTTPPIGADVIMEEELSLVPSEINENEDSEQLATQWEVMEPIGVLIISGALHYLVPWVPSWEPEQNVDPILIKEFESGNREGMASWSSYSPEQYDPETILYSGSGNVPSGKWPVSRIITTEVRNGKPWYLLDWKSTVEPAEFLKHAPEVVKKFHRAILSLYRKSQPCGRDKEPRGTQGKVTKAGVAKQKGPRPVLAE